MYDRIIYKYVVPTEGLKLDLVNPKIVMVGTDATSSSDLPFVWIESDVSGRDDSESIMLRFIGTGQFVPNDHVHVGSCRTYSGLFVWHMYREETKLHKTPTRKSKTNGIQ